MTSRPARDNTEHPEPGHRRFGQVFFDATDMYLRVAWELEEEDGLVARPALGRRLGVSRPTVSEYVFRLIDEGLFVMEQGRVLFTDEGRARATRIVRKHRLVEAFLVDVVGLGWELAHVEASRWQHALGTRAERRLSDMLGRPLASPFGCPIPAGEDDQSTAPGSTHLDSGGQLLRVIEASDSTASRVVIKRVPERLQTDQELLIELARAGIEPEADACVYLDGSAGDRVRVETSSGALTLPALASRSIMVAGERRRPPVPVRPPQRNRVSTFGSRSGHRRRRS